VLSSVSGLVLFLSGHSSMAEPPHLTPATIHAMGANVLSIHVPENVEPKNMQLTVVGAADLKSKTMECVIRFPPLSWHTRAMGEGTDVIVLVFRCTDQVEFAFPTAGVYRMEWLIATGDPESPNLRLTQSVQASPSLEGDVRFLGRMLDLNAVRARTDSVGGEPARLRPLGNQDPDKDLNLAVELVSEVLAYSQTITLDDVWRVAGDRDIVAQAAEDYFALAEELPNSSYASYAAFNAGMRYFSLSGSESIKAVREARLPGQEKDRVGEFVRRGKLLKEDARFAKGVEALQFAVDHGDAYLAPIATYHVGMLRVFCGDVEQGEVLLKRAASFSGERGTVRDLVEKLEPEVLTAKRELLGRRDKGDTQRP